MFNLKQLWVLKPAKLRALPREVHVIAILSGDASCVIHDRE